MKRNSSLLWLAAVLSLCLCACAPAQPQPAEPLPPANGETNTETPPKPEEVLDSPNPVITPPSAKVFTLSFAGDCTFGNNVTASPSAGFLGVVGKNYSYPFANVKTYFENDDYTFVNLECALTESDPTEEEMETLKDKLFRFRGPKDYAKILTMGSVEFASCANNHSKDYGKQGLLDTWDALEAENVAYASFAKDALVTTASGLKIGVISPSFWFSENQITNQIKALRDQGAQLIVVSVHWGDEGTYYPNDLQRQLGHIAVDAGADIVFGHHSHTLQPIEYYNGSVIYYSLGNFSFGGNSNPSDKDSAIIRQQVLLYEDGTVALGDLNIVPCRVSSMTNWNDFRPTPYEKDDPAYDRVLQKLEGSYDGRNLNVSYAPKTTTEN